MTVGSNSQQADSMNRLDLFFTSVYTPMRSGALRQRSTRHRSCLVRARLVGDRVHSKPIACSACFRTYSCVARGSGSRRRAFASLISRNAFLVTRFSVLQPSGQIAVLDVLAVLEHPCILTYRVTVRCSGFRACRWSTNIGIAPSVNVNRSSFCIASRREKALVVLGSPASMFEYAAQLPLSD